MDTIFMETTVQADKFLAKKERKDYIKNICQNKKLVSSTYVLGEFKSNFLKDATKLYNLLWDSETVGEAVIRFEETYSKRINSRMCKLFGNLINECGVNDKTEILDRLEIYIEDILVKRFKKGIDKILIDNTKCLRSLAVPEKYGNTWTMNVSCVQNPNPKCNIKKFLTTDNIDNIKKLVKLPDEMSKMREVIQKVINDEAKPYGNNCRTMGDAIISLEAPNESQILTTNTKDFKPICNCIDKFIL